MTHAEAEALVDAFLSGIQNCIDINEAVTLSGFGKFEPRHKGAVTRRNPQNGEPVEVPPKRGMGFKPSPKVKEFLNRGSRSGEHNRQD